MSASISSDSLSEVLSYFTRLPSIAEEAAFLAVSTVSQRSGLNYIKRSIYNDIEFPKGYLDDRMLVVKKATRGSPVAIIRGRDRPTSLARFAPGQTAGSSRGRGVVVQVKKGRRKIMRNAFIVNLKNGNQGLAVRLKDGEQLRNKKELKSVQLEKNVYLLYGPSVDQAFNTILDEITPKIGDQLRDEFLRQFARLSRGPN